MDSLIGIKGNNFVLLASDRYSMSNVFRVKDDDDKLIVIDGDKVMATAGPVGDRTQFGEFIRKNIHLHRLRTGLKLSATSATHFTRNQLASLIRKDPHNVNLLMAGFDGDKPMLYWLDMLAASVPISKGAHGYGGILVTGILDKYYRPDLTVEEAIEIILKCCNELKTRFLIAQLNFVVKIIDSKGIRTIYVVDGKIQEPCS